MDVKTVFTKTAKGVMQVNKKTQSLTREQTKILGSVDGKSNLTVIADKSGYAVPVVEKTLLQLQKDGFIKKFEVKVEEPLSDFGDSGDDFDFTAPGKISPMEPVFKPSAYRRPTAADQVERATTPPPDFTATQAMRAQQLEIAQLAEQKKKAEELEAALAAAREKAQAEARARAEREAQIRARLEVEAKAKRDAEQRALEEARRAQEAAEKARKDLEAKLAEEKKQRETLSDTKNRLTREQLEKETAHQQALAAARAKAEAEAQALATARAKAEAEAKALAEQRVQAEAAAKKQQEESDLAQKELRAQLKAEIEAKLRAEMEATMKDADIEESAREEVAAAIAEEAREEARRMLDEQLKAEREALAKAGEESKRIAEEEAKRMLAEQEKRIRAEMEEQMAKIAEEKSRVEREARLMAEQQAEAAAKAAAEMLAKLKAEEEARKKSEAEMQERLRAEEEARRKAEAESAARREAEAAARARLEARAKEEAEERARVEAEMAAKLQAEKEATIRAKAQALVEQEMREKAERENRARIEAEQMARAEAEEKAQREVRAREEAMRSAQEAAAGREKAEREAQARVDAERRVAEERMERERREAEDRLASERAAREKAEERFRAEEEAEARQRAAEVARLRELEDNRQRDLAMGVDPDEKKKAYKYGPKKKKASPLGIAVGVLVLLVAVALGAVHFWPLGAQNAKLSKALSAWMHDDVTTDGMHIRLFPKPHITLNQIAVGKSFDVKGSGVKLYMDVMSVFGERYSIKELEIGEITIGPDALNRMGKWADPAERGKGVEIEKLTLRNVKVETKDIAIEPFDTELTFDKAGKVVKAAARVRNGKWSVDFSPSKGTAEAPAQEGEWTVDFSAAGINLPIGAPIPINRATAKGTMAGGTLNFPQVEVKALEGSATGSLKIDFKGGYVVSSEFNVERIKLDQLTEIFTRDVSLTGRMDGQFTLAASAPTLAELLDKPVINGNYTVKEGWIGNVDVVQAMRTPGSVGGQTKFIDLAGSVRISDGVVRYEKLKLSGGVLAAGGAVSVVFSNGNLAGNFSAEIRSSVAQDRATFSVSGKTARPVVKRG
ncbi:MAG: hypothetical protein JNK75_05540 [Betaproteobacteria bacterium]|nr:hypothetical protein [Betaproteobacteria bacterium]